MHSWMQWCAVLALVAGCARGQETLPPGIAWRPDWRGALEQAKTENKPVMVAFIMWDEPANVQVARSHFKNREIIEFSRHFVCVLGCSGGGKTEEGVRWDGSKGKVCERFGSVTPGEYNATEMAARGELADSPWVSAPQFVFLAPDGETVLLRHVWLLPPREFLQKMKLAYAFHDPKSAPPGFDKQLDHVTALMKQAESTNQPQRRTALRTLARSDDPRVPRWLAKRTRGNVDSNHQIEAIFFMGERGNAKALPCLHEVLTRRDTQTRIFCSVALERIAMKESVPHLLKVLKTERNDRVKSNVLRALMACGGDTPEIRKIIIRQIGSGSQLDRVTALTVACSLRPEKDLARAIRKAARNRNTQVRCAAFYAIGSLGLVAEKKWLEKAVRSQRGVAEDFGAWALECLGGPPYSGDTDLEGKLDDWMPDEELRRGELKGI